MTLTSPEEGFSDIAGCTFQFAAEASDPDGAVDRVEFYVNGALLGTDDEAPFELELRPNGPVGENTAFARAFDNGNPALSTDSPPVTFVLLVPPPAPPGQDPCRSGVPPVPPEPGTAGPVFGDNVAFAPAFDTTDPPLSNQSPPVTVPGG